MVPVPFLLLGFFLVTLCLWPSGTVGNRTLRNRILRFPKIVCPTWGQSLSRGQLWSCWVCLVLQEFRLFLGLGAQIRHLSLSPPQLPLSTLQKHYVWKGNCPILAPKKSIFMQSTKNNSDHPHPPYLQKICHQNMPYNGGPYGIKIGENQGISTENMAYGPNFYGIRTPHLCHMNRFYWGWGWSLICWSTPSRASVQCGRESHKRWGKKTSKGQMFQFSCMSSPKHLLRVFLP